MRRAPFHAVVILACAASAACGRDRPASRGDAGIEAGTRSSDASFVDADTEDATSALDAGTTSDPPPEDAGPDVDPRCLLDAAPALQGGTWSLLTNQPPFAPDMGLLLTDGTVMVHDFEHPSNWWRLAPDANGSYRTGTWTELASLPEGYAPLDFASAVLPDGRVLVEGGEFNNGSAGYDRAFTSRGALYDPTRDQWQSVAPPVGWTGISDAPSVVLANGVFMIGTGVGAGGSGEPLNQQALFDPSTLTWTTTGAGKADDNVEEGWELLPNGDVLVLDTNACSGTTLTSCQSSPSETYDPTTGAWSDAGAAPAPLYDSMNEIGPAVLMTDGRVFAIGAYGNTALRAADGAWSAGPNFPPSTACESGIFYASLPVTSDTPAVLLPNGHVLCFRAFEFDGTNLLPVASMGPILPGNFLLLPTGETLAFGSAAVTDSITGYDFTTSTPQIEVYAAAGAPDPSWAPTITSVPTTLTHGTSYVISGTQFNGLSQAVMYGDDLQAATNYPLVRITNLATNHVAYARTHDHSTMGVATGTQIVSTSFDVPSDIETGAGELVVVANGIASTPVAVTIE